ncbi:hypothetical protein [Litoreibacter halocynthiae]|uniref:hypothetical protein n=1 Tax=Litoreibacter halocynthiae TaxID=1242689 RepID=UPI002490A1A5|nr:hypothetical protein [Litoreibacter halocynthiae]
MPNAGHMFLLISATALTAASVNAEPSVPSACAYFALSEVSITPPMKNVEFIGEPEFTEFVLKEEHLARYQLWAIENITRELATIRSDGRLLPTGAVSYALRCFVDVIDRRVLKIMVSDGVDANTAKELSNGKSRIVDGVEYSVFDIGLRAHQGKY